MDVSPDGINIRCSFTRNRQEVICPISVFLDIHRFSIKNQDKKSITLHLIFVAFMVKIGDKGDIGHWSPYIATCNQMILISIDVSV